MKFALVTLALFAVAAADVSHLSQEYLPPVEGDIDVRSGSFGHGVAGHGHGLPNQEYLPPVDEEVQPGHELGEDGYRYKTNRARRIRYRFRNRRH